MSNKLELVETRDSKNSRGQGAVFVPKRQRNHEEGLTIKIEPSLTGGDYNYTIRGGPIDRLITGSVSGYSEAKIEIKNDLTKLTKQDVNVLFNEREVARR